MRNLKLVEVIKKNSGEERQKLYNHTDMTTAVAALENDFGAQVKDSTTVSIYCILIDNDNGDLIERLYWADTSSDEQADFDSSIKLRVYSHNDYTTDNLSSFDTERLAIGNYHTKIASEMNNAECNKAVTILIDYNGCFKELSIFERPQEDPE